MTKFDFTTYIEDNTLRLEASGRGGGIEIDASEYLGVEGAKMTAHQNYLGGGMLGSIGNSFNHECYGEDVDTAKRDELAEALARYFHQLTNHDDDEWEAADFEATQQRPGSAY